MGQLYKIQYDVVFKNGINKIYESKWSDEELSHDEKMDFIEIHAELIKQVMKEGSGTFSIGTGTSFLISETAAISAKMIGYNDK